MCIRDRLKDLMIGEERVELEMCVPGQTVPEAFTRQMSLMVNPIAVSFLVGAFVNECTIHEYVCL